MQYPSVSFFKSVEERIIPLSITNTGVCDVPVQYIFERTVSRDDPVPPAETSWSLMYLVLREMNAVTEDE